MILKSVTPGQAQESPPITIENAAYVQLVAEYGRGKLRELSGHGDEVLIATRNGVWRIDATNPDAEPSHIIALGYSRTGVADIAFGSDVIAISTDLNVLVYQDDGTFITQFANWQFPPELGLPLSYPDIFEIGLVDDRQLLFVLWRATFENYEGYVLTTHSVEAELPLVNSVLLPYDAVNHSNITIHGNRLAYVTQSFNQAESGYYSQVSMIDMDTGDLLWQLTNEDRFVIESLPDALYFVAEGMELVIASGNGIAVVDVETGDPGIVLRSDDDRIVEDEHVSFRAFTLVDNGRAIAFYNREDSGANAQLGLWRIGVDQLIEFPVDLGSAVLLADTPDELSVLVAGTQRPDVYLFDFLTGEQRLIADYFDQSVQVIGSAADGGVYSAGRFVLRHWRVDGSIQSGSHALRLPYEMMAGQDELLLLAESLERFDIASLEALGSIDAWQAEDIDDMRDDRGSQFRMVSFHAFADGRFAIAELMSDNDLLLWQINGDMVRVITAPENYIAVTHSPTTGQLFALRTDSAGDVFIDVFADSERLAAYIIDTPLFMNNTDTFTSETRPILRVSIQDENRVYVLSPDCMLLELQIMPANDVEASVINLQSAMQIGETCTDITFSSVDENLIAVADLQHVRLYDLGNNVRLQETKITQGLIRQVVFSVDGSRLFVLSSNDVIHVYSVE